MSELEVIDRMLGEIAELRVVVRAEGEAQLSSDERARVIASLKAIFGDSKAGAFQRKDESGAAARLGKQVDKQAATALAAFEELLTPLLAPEQLERLERFDHAFRDALCHTVVAYLASSGRLDAAELLCDADTLARLAQFRRLRDIVEQLRQRRLDAALAWLGGERRDADSEALLFQLHELAFLELLLGADGRRDAALAYGRSHLSAFAATHWRRVGYLCSAALFDRAELPSSPYAKLVDEYGDAWQRAAVAVSVAFARVCGVPETPTLVVALRCAWPVVPALGKLVALKRRGLAADASTVALPLAADERYHTVFACPVTRAQTASSNPPTMLPCRHVLARDSAVQLINRSGMIKCPYCPMQTTLANCKTVHF